MPTNSELKLELAAAKMEILRLRAINDTLTKAMLGNPNVNRSIVAYAKENEQLKKQVERLEIELAAFQAEG
jgi:predicted  nucleic acid-binding Zn-ribbon protein